MRLIGGLILGLLLAQTAGSDQRSYVLTDFCKVLNNPKQFAEKEITLRATWKYGSEWTFLYCVACRDADKVWFDTSDETDAATEKALDAIPRGAGILNITATGVFSTGGAYGHLGGYRHKFIAKRVWDIVVLSRGMKSPEAEKEIEAKYGCGGTDPK